MKEYVFGWPFMTSYMKFFNFRKRLYRKVNHCNNLVSKTIIEPLKLLKYGKRKILISKPTVIKSKKTLNFNPLKSRSENSAKTKNYPDNQTPNLTVNPLLYSITYW